MIWIDSLRHFSVKNFKQNKLNVVAVKLDFHKIIIIIIQYTWKLLRIDIKGKKFKYHCMRNVQFLHK